MKEYTANYKATDNYINGMKLIKADKLREAIATLSGEPIDSPCRGLALVNIVLCHLRLGNFSEATTFYDLAIEMKDEIIESHPPSLIQLIRNYGEAQNSQSNLHLSIKTFNLAIDYADKILISAPDDDVALQKGHALNSLATSYLKLNNYEECCVILRKALDIYGKIPSSDCEGRPQALCNLAKALKCMDKNTEASLALEESLELSKKCRDVEQELRTKFDLLSLSKVVPDGSSLESFLMESIDTSPNPSVAHIRICNAIKFAMQAGDIELTNKLFDIADINEEALDIDDISPAKLSIIRARHYISNGGIENAIFELVKGCDAWFKRLSRLKDECDFNNISKEMHDYFRMLSHLLVINNRLGESFSVMEVARALGYAFEIDKSRVSDVLKSNPFSRELNQVSTNACVLVK